MTDTEQLTPVPPRSLTVPQMPSPQTVSGILSDSGLPSDSENITDLPPDYGWMAGIEEYLFQFSITHNSVGSVVDFYPQYKFHGVDQATLINLNQMTWHWLPFGASRWWSGHCRIRFMAIKPPRVPCKLLVRYMPDVSNYVNGGFDDDKLRRGIKYEWDLALTQDCSLDISGYNWTSLRPTWITRFSGSDASLTADAAKSFKSWMPHLSQVSLGMLRVEIANPMIPGNIFPDDMRILVFQSFPDAQFYNAIDPRSMKYHFFTLGRPWIVDTKTLYPE